jgi:hypothetical protein
MLVFLRAALVAAVAAIRDDDANQELRVAAAGHFTRQRQSDTSAVAASKDEASQGTEQRHRHSEQRTADQEDFELPPLGKRKRHQADIDTGPLLSKDLVDISNAIARDAAEVARQTMPSSGGSLLEVEEEGTPKSQKEKNSTKNHGDKPQVLFVIYTDSKFYNTRVRWARSTWAKDLSSSQLVFIGDGKAPADVGAYVHETRCRPNNRTVGMCCKYAEAVVLAQTMIWKNPDLKWVYVADDDTFIRAAEMEKALLSQPRSHPSDRGLVLANWACVTESCSQVFCGGAGYAANRWAIDIMTGGDPAGFIQQLLQNCDSCGGSSHGSQGVWGEAGLSEVMKTKGFETRELQGIHGWMLDKSCLEFSLESPEEPLMYHMIRTKSQMEFLQRLFAPPSEQTGSSVPPGSKVALEGLGGCVEYRGNVQCAASREQEDQPWHGETNACKTPRLPRLPVLLGVFILALLFGILMTFVWAGFKYQEWDGWKLQGVKWHNHHLLGRQRFR